MMKASEVKKMVGLVGNCAYNEVNKQEFRRLSMKFLRELRSEAWDFRCGS